MTTTELVLRNALERLVGESDLTLLKTMRPAVEKLYGPGDEDRAAMLNAIDVLILTHPDKD